MTSCAIILSHYESLAFLHAAIRQIRKHKNKSVWQYIIVADQSSIETYLELEKTYEHDKDITIIHLTNALWSGYGIDHCMRYENIETDYVVELHADAFPIADTWLLLPIKLIEEYGFSFVGQLQFISKPTDKIYPPNNGFFCMAQSFNLGRTETYKELSDIAGFTRFHNRPDSGMNWPNTDWEMWAREDYNARGSDDSVVAYCWEDNHREHDKLGLAISGFIQPNFGRIIDDLVFHFCSAREASGNLGAMPELYQYYTKKINENYSDELIEELVSLAKSNRPPSLEILTRNFWNGKTKQSSPPSEELNKRIEELKNM